MDCRLCKNLDLKMVPLLIGNHSLLAQLTCQVGYGELSSKESPKSSKKSVLIAGFKDMSSGANIPDSTA